MSTFEQWQFGLLCLFAVMGWLLWLMTLSQEWYLVGFANWLVRRLFVAAQVATAIARGASAYLAEYRMVRKQTIEPLSEYAEVASERR